MSYYESKHFAECMRAHISSKVALIENFALGDTAGYYCSLVIQKTDPDQIQIAAIWGQGYVHLISSLFYVV